MATVTDSRAGGSLNGRSYRRYVLGTLTLVYTLNYLDRGLIILLLQPIKEDLQLTDTQLGFVTGIAFAAFYATLGVPIARWADRGNRSTIAALAIGLWGLTVMACMWVTNFVQLVCARIAAAVGESGCMPPTYSLVGDYFPEAAERTRAMAIYWLASPLALLISMTAGGWINDRYGWRMTFFVMGIPALAAAALAKLTVIDPRTRAAREAAETVVGGQTLATFQLRRPVTEPARGAGAVPARSLPRMSAVLSILWKQRSSRNLITAVVLFWTMGLGLAPWYAAFLMRSHGMDTAELGLWLGGIFGFGGIAGNLLGGYAAARWLANDERAQMRFSAVAIAAMIPLFALFLLEPNKHWALGALMPLMVSFGVFLGPTFALLQRLVTDEMRATTMAVVMLLANLIGMGIGPQIVGILSDRLAPALGQDSLRYAMLAMSTVALWSAFHFWRVGRTVAQDLQAAHASLRSHASQGAAIQAAPAAVSD